LHSNTAKLDFFADYAVFAIRAVKVKTSNETEHISNINIVERITAVCAQPVK